MLGAVLPHLSIAQTNRTLPHLLLEQTAENGEIVALGLAHATIDLSHRHIVLLAVQCEATRNLENTVVRRLGYTSEVR